MQFQKLVFVTNNNEFLERKTFWKQLRLAFYEIRDFYSAENNDAQVSFALLSNDNSENRLLKSANLETFSVSESNKNTLFEQITLENFLTYIGEQQNSGQNVKIFYFHNDLESDFTESSFVQKENFVQVIDVIDSKIFDFSVIVEKGLRNKNVKAPKVEKEKNVKQKSKVKRPLNKKLIPVFAASLVVILLISLLPMLINFIKLKSVKYQEVYTGDGDRLILRTADSRDGEELLRLNEGEVVKVIKIGEEWNNVEYHGFVGYLNNKYLIESVSEKYEIINPDSMYNYAKGCLKFNNVPGNGYEWLEKAAKGNLLIAKWEMYKLYNTGNDSIGQNSTKAKYWLDEVTGSYSGGCYEDELIELYKKSAEVAKNAGKKDIEKNFNSKITDRERTKKEIYRAAYQKQIRTHLDEGYVEAAATLYEFAMNTLGISGNSDLMIEIADAMKTDSEKIKWWNKAYDLGSFDAALKLATYYDGKNNYSKAATYFETCYKRSYWDADYYALKAGECYIQDGNWYMAYSWCKNAYNANYWSSYHSKAAYYLGFMLEYGKGCSRDYYKALDYYKEAMNVISEAKTAYNRLYEDLYW